MNRNHYQSIDNSLLFFKDQVSRQRVISNWQNYPKKSFDAFLIYKIVLGSDWTKAYSPPKYYLHTYPLKGVFADIYISLTSKEKFYSKYSFLKDNLSDYFFENILDIVPHIREYRNADFTFKKGVCYMLEENK